MVSPVRFDSGVLRLVFLGPPGSGKGTQAAVLQRRLSLRVLSTGEMLRRAVAQRTDLGLAVESLIGEGKLVPDGLINGVVARRLSELDCVASGYVLDGYPRTLSQAVVLHSLLGCLGHRLSSVLLFELSDEIALARVSGRAWGALQVRADDTRAVCRKRLSVYRAEIGPLADYYGRSGILRIVDASQSPEAVSASIRCLLGV